MSLAIDLYAENDGERIGAVRIEGAVFPEAVIWGGQVYSAMQSEAASAPRYLMTEVVSIDHEQAVPRLYEPSEVDAIVERACGATDEALGASIARANEWQARYERLASGQAAPECPGGKVEP